MRTKEEIIKFKDFLEKEVRKYQEMLFNTNDQNEADEYFDIINDFSRDICMLEWVLEKETQLWKN